MSNFAFKADVASSINEITNGDGSFDAQFEAFFSAYPDADQRVTAAEAVEQIVAGVI